MFLHVVEGVKNTVDNILVAGFFNALRGIPYKASERC